MRTAAIIVAAGSGSRFGSETPKQFLEINGKPVIAHTIERFETAPSIDSIVLVLPAEWAAGFDTSPFRKISNVVAGGDSRAGSVRNGIDVLGKDIEIVAVHDGARPLVTVEEIEGTISKAKETGAACLLAPVTDTIKLIKGDKIIRTVDRTGLRRALTPQAFRIDILKSAYDPKNFDPSATDECAMVERLDYWYEISSIEGSPRNIKITHSEDLILAEALMAAERQRQVALPDR